MSISITQSADGVQFDVRVIPRAGRTGIAGAREGALVVRLAASPVEGEANAALITFIAKLLDRPKRDIDIVSGQKSRAKRVRVRGLTIPELDAKLSGILPA